MTSSKDIFLSYGREPEVVGFVTQLKHDLETRGLSVWLDTEDIPAGCDWHAAIGTGLHNCRALIAVITSKYISSRYCTSELYTADGDQKTIFPVIFEDVDFSLSEKSKGVKYVISGINWTMFRPNIDHYQFSLNKLIEGMKESGLAAGGTDAVDAGDLSAQMSGMHLSPQSKATPTAPARPPSPYGFQPPQMTPPHTSPYGYYSPSPGHSYHTSPYHHPSPYPPQPMQAHGYYPPYGNMGYPAYTQSPQTFSSPPAQMTTPPHVPTTPPQEATPTPPPPQYAELFPTNTQQQTIPTDKPPSKFKVGMKLEAVDRRFPYFVCVATIMDRNDEDHEVLVHFDGWSDEYDYWCPCESVELHPAGWSDKHNWELQSPYGQGWSGWKGYLEETQAEAAPGDSFSKGQSAGPGSLLFTADMRVEAKDRHNPSLICAATITSVKKGKLLIHFDGWGHEFDYWCPVSSTDVHPPMWCGKNGWKVCAPRGYSGFFKWNEYLSNPDINPAPAHLFTEEQLSADGRRKKRSPQQGVESLLGGFKVGMKLEAKDRLNPTMVAVATVGSIKDGQLLIHFDSWSSRYDYWCKPDCGDIHPKGWCESNRITLHPPKGSFSFNWDSYLRKCSAVAAPPTAFTAAQKAM